MLEDVGAFSYVPKNDLENRAGRLCSLLAGAGVDFAVIIQNVDRFYFTGTMQKGVVIIPVDNDPLVFVEKGFERAEAETPFEIIPVRPASSLMCCRLIPSKERKGS
ncbi:MAG: xaa-pro aminopeptidase [Deltaproteobacteria bacterium]|nr:xaa-pro aminopeptidase [Deltaproteobacteria bacterium]